MLSRAWTWIKTREPLAVASAVLVVVTAAATAVADLPPETTWPALAWAVLAAVVRQYVTPAAKQ